MAIAQIDVCKACYTTGKKAESNNTILLCNRNENNSLELIRAIACDNFAQSLGNMFFKKNFAHAVTSEWRVAPLILTYNKPNRNPAAESLGGYRRRTNVQQLTCKIDLSNSFYYLFFSFVLLELKPFVLKGKVRGEKL